MLRFIVEIFKAYLKERYKGVSVNNINAGASCLFFNGRAIPNADLVNKIESIEDNENVILHIKIILWRCI